MLITKVTSPTVPIYVKSNFSEHNISVNHVWKCDIRSGNELLEEETISAGYIAHHDHFVYERFEIGSS